MAVPVGRFVIAQATLRLTTTTARPPGTDIDTPSLTVTAANNNGATVFLTTSTTTNATIKRTTGVPLTAGQSFTFTGVPIGTSGYRNFYAGTGNFYFSCVSTPVTVVFTYYKQS